jgi:hypothetical protein
MISLGDKPVQFSSPNTPADGIVLGIVLAGALGAAPMPGRVGARTDLPPNVLEASAERGLHAAGRMDLLHPQDIC